MTTFESTQPARGLAALQPAAYKFCGLGLLWVLCLTSVGPGLAQDKESKEKEELKERVEAGIQNPAVREYFRERFSDATTARDAIALRRNELPIELEEQIDRMARIFLRKVIQEVAAVESFFEVTREHRRASKATIPAQQRRNHFSSWKATLQGLGKSVKNLRRTVRPVLRMAYRKSMKKGATHLMDLTSPPGVEGGLDTLETDVSAALARTESFFLGASHTVTLTTLTENDLLVMLERIESLARDLSDRL